MITKYEKIVAQLNGVDRSTAIKLLRVYANGTIPKLTDYGLESVTVSDGALMTSDGREVVWIDGTAWALKPEIHAKRLAEAMEQARQRNAELAAKKEQAANTTTLATTCTTLIDGQLCGGALSATPVCPRCALGKQGVAQIMTCDVCGAQTAVMR